MTTFTLNIDVKGAAFTGPGEPHLECARLLRTAFSALLKGDSEGKLLDVNGNSCGSWALAEPEFRWRTVTDDHGVDLGDWLPQTEEHYLRVGPFTTDGGDTQQTWEEYRADPSSQPDNYIALGLVLDRRDPGQDEWSEAVQSLWGITYYTGSDYPSDDERWMRIEDITDEHMREIAKDLLIEETG